MSEKRNAVTEERRLERMLDNAAHAEKNAEKRAQREESARGLLDRRSHEKGESDE